MYSLIYDDVTDFEAFGFTKNTKSKYLEKKKLVFLQLKRCIHYTLTVKIWKKVVL